MADERTKKILIGVACVVVIALAAGAIVRIGKSRGSLRAPRAVRGEILSFIDLKTGKAFSKTREAWDKWEMQQTRQTYYKNPETGEFTLSGPMKCPECGKTIGTPLCPIEDMHEDDPKMVAEYEKWRKEQICPFCKKEIFAPLVLQRL